MKKQLRPLIYALVAAGVALTALSQGTTAFAGPDQCKRNCQGQHCPRGTCSDDQHERRLAACLKKCP
ncbi:MAG: hypothetical protein U1E65_02065 [Myxococcota bacterium]